MNASPEPLPETETPATQSNVVATDAATPKRSKMRWALIISLAGHAVLLLVLLFWYLPKRNADGQKVAQPAANVSDKSSGQQIPSPSAPPPELMAPRAADDIPAEQIQKSIASQIEAVKKLPVAAKLSELDKNLRRLKSLANEKSVEQISEKIGSTLGLDTQAYQPKTDVPEGRFDFDTAQLSDVARRQGENGNWIYDATLVDSQGRTSQVELSAAEGKTMHDLFTKMKKYPMAAGIYRSVVMPMLQKMIAAEKQAKKLAREAERLQAEEESSQ